MKAKGSSQIIVIEPNRLWILASTVTSELSIPFPSLPCSVFPQKPQTLIPSEPPLPHSKLYTSFMAPTSAPSPSPTHLQLTDRLDIASIRNLISIVDLHIHRFLSDPVARKSLHLKCSSTLTISNHHYFEFFDHSVLSSLHWGIESIELVILADCLQERSSRCLDIEKMLQKPALLEEEGSTAGISNRYIVSCSYFYLSLVRKLQRDEWQMTMHFLQSVLVSPSYVRTDFAAELWRRLFGSMTVGGGGEGAIDEAARQLARRYKDWLMYYRVISYGEAHPRSDQSLVADTEKPEWEDSRYTDSGSIRYSNSFEKAPHQPSYQDAKMVYQPGLLENIEGENAIIAKASISKSVEKKRFSEIEDAEVLSDKEDEDFYRDIKESFDIKCLQDMLEDSQSDTSVPCYSHFDSYEDGDSQEKKNCQKSAANTLSENPDILASQIGDRIYPVQSTQKHAHIAHRYPVHSETYEINATYLLSSRSHSSVNNLSFSILDFRDAKKYHFDKYNVIDETPPGGSPTRDFRCFGNFPSKFVRKYTLPESVPQGSFSRKKLNFSSSERLSSEEGSSYEKDKHIEFLGKFDKAISALFFSEGTGKAEDSEAEVTTIWEILKKKTEVKYSSFKHEILDHLLDIISTSRKERVLRASVSTLLVLVSEDRTVIEDIKRKKSHLFVFASALKRNVHEAAILIYLLKPPPSEIRKLELLPALVEVACSTSHHNKDPISLPLTPTSASIAMIEVLVTAFDYVTNNMHLAVISSPQILAKLVNVAMNKNLEEGVALAAILVRCMRLNGNCKKFLSQVTPVDPFLHLLRSDDRRAELAALEYFHEILRMPRSSATHLLHQIRQQGTTSIMQTLLACIKQTDLQHQLLAANLLLQLDMLEGSNHKSVFREEALEVLLASVASDENSNMQTLSAFILSNLGGTYAWNGEPYTAAWLIKKAGITSAVHRNMIRDVDWFEPCLQDSEIGAWSAKAARAVIKTGSSIFNALIKGLRSKIKSVSHYCLVTIAWLGSEMAVRGPSNLRYSACEILLGEIASFLHPGSELDERVLACLCIYSYTSGKGKQKLMNFAESIRESLRRLSGTTWMAEELLKVTDFFLPTKPRVSCVHTQILEVGQVGNVAATALIYYRGQLCAGYSDGSIKVWDIKGQKGMLIWEDKEHTRPVTCFTLFEPGDSLLSGSTDKTIRVWKMVQLKLVCVEVIDMKEPVQKLDSYGDKILAITQGRGLRVLHASRNIQTISKNKQVKSRAVAQGKIYLGCMDSSIQEIDLAGDHKTEIRAAASSWRIQNKPISSIVVYKGWIYCAGAIVEGSSMKEWRRCRRPTVSLPIDRGTNVQTMAVVEDFIYLNCSSSRSVIQIWLRGRQQKVGRLSAGSKITSLLEANDIVFCGTETGLIKGWIPL